MKKDNKRDFTEVHFFCKKCKKIMSVTYEVTGDDDAPVLPSTVLKCQTHKCVRVLRFKGFTEKELLAHTDKQGIYRV